MNYELIYNNLVISAKKRDTTKGYVEVHHIIPRSVGGKNDKSNLVTFTAREHFIAHWLLTKIHKNKRSSNIMNKAFTGMNMQNSSQRRSSLTSHRYKALRVAYRDSVTGEGNPMYGKTPYNYGLPVWYCNVSDKHIYSNEKPTPTSVKGRKVQVVSNTAYCGVNNHMSGINVLDTLSKEKVQDIMDNRRSTYYSKTSKERSTINLARANGYEYIIDDTHYDTKTHAIRSLGVSYKQLQTRCKSNRFPDWSCTPRKQRYTD